VGLTVGDHINARPIYLAIMCVDKLDPPDVTGVCHDFTDEGKEMICYLGDAGADIDHSPDDSLFSPLACFAMHADKFGIACIRSLIEFGANTQLAEWQVRRFAACTHDYVMGYELTTEEKQEHARIALARLSMARLSIAIIDGNGGLSDKRRAKELKRFCHFCSMTKKGGDVRKFNACPCGDAHYCNKTCQQAAWQTHKHESTHATR